MNTVRWILLLLITSSTSHMLAQSSHSMDLPLNPSGMPVPGWSGGALVYVRDYKSEAPVFVGFDRSGREVLNCKLTLPGARLINVLGGSYARGSDASLLVTGSAYSNESQFSRFFALLSPDCGQQTVVQLTPLFAEAAALAPDGTVWLAGGETPAPQQRQFKPESHVIWRFDRGGKQIGSSVPVSTFQTSSGFHPALASRFVVSRDRVGWFSPAGRAYIEFSLDGRMLDQYPIPEILASVNRTPYPALCEDGSVHLGVIFNKGSDQREGRKGWGIFRLNRDTRQWELRPRSEQWGMVFGCDGNVLVTTTDHKKIAWLPPENRQN